MKNCGLTFAEYKKRKHGGRKMDEFNEGAIVTIKSCDEPRMVITNIQNEGDGSARATCVWFDDNKQFHNGLFNVAILYKRKK